MNNYEVFDYMKDPNIDRRIKEICEQAEKNYIMINYKPENEKEEIKNTKNFQITDFNSYNRIDTPTKSINKKIIEYDFHNQPFIPKTINFENENNYFHESNINQNNFYSQPNNNNQFLNNNQFIQKIENNENFKQYNFTKEISQKINQNLLNNQNVNEINNLNNKDNPYDQNINQQEQNNDLFNFQNHNNINNNNLNSQNNYQKFLNQINQNININSNKDNINNNNLNNKNNYNNLNNKNNYNNLNIFNDNNLNIHNDNNLNIHNDNNLNIHNDNTLNVHNDNNINFENNFQNEINENKNIENNINNINENNLSQKFINSINDSIEFQKLNNLNPLNLSSSFSSLNSNDYLLKKPNCFECELRNLIQRKDLYHKKIKEETEKNNLINKIILEGKNLLSKEKYEECYDKLNNLINQNLNHPDIFFLFGETCRKLKLMEEAEKYLILCLNFKNCSPYAFYSLSLLYEECCQYKYSNYFLKKCLNFFNNSDIYFLLGKNYFKLNNNFKALNFINIAIEKNASNQFYYQLRSEIYNKIGRSDLGKKDEIMFQIINNKKK